MRPDTVRDFIGEYVATLDSVHGPRVPVRGDQTFEEVGVDSISIVDLVARVERRFEVRIPDATLPTLINLDDMVDTVVGLVERASTSRV